MTWLQVKRRTVYYLRQVTFLPKQKTAQVLLAADWQAELFIHEVHERRRAWLLLCLCTLHEEAGHDADRLHCYG